MPRYFVLFRFIFDYSNMWVILLPVVLLAWFIGWKGTKGRCLPAALVGAVVYLACEGSYFLPIQSYGFEFLMIYLGTFGLGAALGFLAAWGMGRSKETWRKPEKRPESDPPRAWHAGDRFLGAGRDAGGHIGPSLRGRASRARNCAAKSVFLLAAPPPFSFCRLQKENGGWIAAGHHLPPRPVRGNWVPAGP